MQSKLRIFATAFLVFSLSYSILFLSSTVLKAVVYNTGSQCSQSPNCTKEDEPYESGAYYVGKDSAKLPYVCPFEIQDIRVKAGNGYEKYSHLGVFIEEFYGQEQQDNADDKANYDVDVFETYITVKKLNQHTQDISHVEIWCLPNGQGDAEFDPLKITKTALTSYTTTWVWNITKVADVESLTLELGKSKTINYSVKLVPTPIGSLWKVFGGITVYNPNDIAVEIIKITDVVSPDIDVSVTCPVSFPYSLASNATLECTYQQTLPNNLERTNKANVFYDDESLEKYSYIVKPFDFLSATVTHVDECIDVTDDKYGYLGEVCANSEMASHKFEYKLDIKGEACGVGTYTNTATGITNDSETQIKDSATVNFTVGGDECLSGDEGEVQGVTTTEVKGATTVVLAATAGGDRSTVYLIQSLLLLTTGMSLIYVGREYLNRA